MSMCLAARFLQEALPTKKNRLQSDDVAEATCSMTSSPPRQSNIEGEKVGHIRKRVQDLSWKQRKEGGRDDVEEDDEEDEEEESGEENEEEESVKKSKGTEVDAAAAKAKSNETQPVATQPVAPVASVPDTDTASTKGLTQKSPPLPPARTQPTFSSFSKSSSPFNSATASIAGPSWLAGKSSGSGGLKPSALGSMPGSNPQSESGSPGPSTSAAGSLSPAQGSATGKSLGFGAFAASNPFAAKGGSARTSSPVAGTDKTTGEEAAEGENGNSKSFDEALREGGTSEERDKSQKVETQLDKGHADCKSRTGAVLSSSLFYTLPHPRQYGRARRARGLWPLCVPSCSSWQMIKAGKKGAREWCDAMCQKDRPMHRELDWVSVIVLFRLTHVAQRSLRTACSNAL